MKYFYRWNLRFFLNFSQVDENLVHECRDKCLIYTNFKKKKFFLQIRNISQPSHTPRLFKGLQVRKIHLTFNAIASCKHLELVDWLLDVSLHIFCWRFCFDHLAWLSLPRGVLHTYSPYVKVWIIHTHRFTRKLYNNFMETETRKMRKRKMQKQYRFHNETFSAGFKVVSNFISSLYLIFRCFVLFCFVSFFFFVIVVVFCFLFSVRISHSSSDEQIIIRVIRFLSKCFFFFDLIN